MKAKPRSLFALLLAGLLVLSGCEDLTALMGTGPNTAAVTTYTVDNIPAYSGEAYVTLSDNIPGFSDDELTTEAFEAYSELDRLGRCGVAYANICTELMPTEERGSIGQVKPSGWHTVRYDGLVDGNYLYNRCHLIGYQLAGENANEKNLITGTRYLNITGMLPFEDQVADYVHQTDHHVLYRVTPIFDGDDLVAQGVEMEALSVEDGGEGVSFHVLVYNVQPGVTIDYATGDSWLDDEAASNEVTASAEVTEAVAAASPDVTETPDEADAPAESDASVETTTTTGQSTYVLNTRSMRFHYPSCSGVATMSENNKSSYTGSREDLIAQGYTPCGQCQP
jgi:DNA-entry nuclease